jgi:hypothetical protein
MLASAWSRSSLSHRSTFCQTIKTSTTTIRNISFLGGSKQIPVPTNYDGKKSIFESWGLGPM